MIPPVRCLLLVTSAALVLGACEREKVAVYTAPKELPPQPKMPAQPDADAEPNTPQLPPRPALPRMAWILPAGWVQAPAGQMSAANFAVHSPQGEATIAITPLMNLAGKEELIVNMWRQQVGQEPLSSDDVKKTLSDVEIAGGKGQLFEIEGVRDGKPTRIVTAMQHDRAGSSWFYKMAGDTAVVDAQKPAFLQFLKSIQFEEPAAGSPTTSAPAPAASAPTQTASAPAPAAAAPTEESEFKWQVPEGWQQIPAGQMQVAKFTVPEQSGAKAEVAVSVFGSDTGGMLANVNRWRAQVGQPPVDEAGLGEVAKPLEGAPAGATVVDLTGETKSIVGAVVPRDGRYFFYKMTGDPAAVKAAKDAFVAFAKAQP